MKISGFSYIRNGFKYGYPFLQSIQSILPICDEFVIAVGDSEDGTREAILNLGSSKIKIIDTVWDEQMRSSGKIFAQQANMALREITGDWGFHIQADELIHENDLPKIKQQILAADPDPKIEGLLFDFLNFHGSFNYLNDTRYQHKKEIRIIRNGRNIYSYKDSQGFRRYPSYETLLNNHKGFKLNVAYIHLPVFHYNYVRNPKEMGTKTKFFESFWHDDSYIENKYQSEPEFDYYHIERVKRFEGDHPLLMKPLIEKEDWIFDPGKIHRKLSLKEQFLYWVEDRLNYQIGEYKNYKVLRGN